MKAVDTSSMTKLIAPYDKNGYVLRINSDFGDIDYIDWDGAKEIFKYLAEKFKVKLEDYWDKPKISWKDIKPGMIIRDVSGFGILEILSFYPRSESDSPTRYEGLYVRANVLYDHGTGISNYKKWISSDNIYHLIGEFELTEPTPPTTVGSRFSVTSRVDGGKVYDFISTSDMKYVVIGVYSGSMPEGAVYSRDELNRDLARDWRVVL